MGVGDMPPDRLYPTAVIEQKVFCSLRTKVEKLKVEVPESVRVVVSLCGKPKHFSFPDAAKRLLLNTKKQPVPRKNWILHFTEINAAIMDGVQAGSTWIIANTKSEIKLVLVAYLVTSQKLTLHEAISSLSKLRKSNLTEELFIQIQLWAAMGGVMDDSFPPWRLYRSEIHSNDSRPISSRFRTSSMEKVVERSLEARRHFEGTKTTLNYRY